MDKITRTLIEDQLGQIKFETEKLMMSGVAFDKAKSQALRQHVFTGIAAEHKPAVIKLISEMPYTDLQGAVHTSEAARQYRVYLALSGKSDGWLRRFLFVRLGLSV
ncbi:MAG: hypothetical protein AAF468_20085 [Pseudomonadota bacterium]